MNDEELKRQADSDWIDHTDSPYERYLKLKLARTVKQRDELLAACVAFRNVYDFERKELRTTKTARDWDVVVGGIIAAIDAVKECEPAKT